MSQAPFLRKQTSEEITMPRDDEIEQEETRREFRPQNDDLSGGKDKSVESEARDATGNRDPENTGSRGGGATGTIEDLDRLGRPGQDDETIPFRPRGR